MNPHGIGLGLTICNNVLNQYGSELQLDSEFGKGTTFFFIIDLPVTFKEEVKELNNITSEFLGSYDVSLSSHKSKQN